MEEERLSNHSFTFVLGVYEFAKGADEWGVLTLTQSTDLFVNKAVA